MNDLVIELLQEIIEYLDRTALVKFSSTCRRNRQVSSKFLWKTIILQPHSNIIDHNTVKEKYTYPQILFTNTTNFITDHKHVLPYIKEVITIGCYDKHNIKLTSMTNLLAACHNLQAIIHNWDPRTVFTGCQMETFTKTLLQLQHLSYINLHGDIWTYLNSFKLNTSPWHSLEVICSYNVQCTFPISLINNGKLKRVICENPSASQLEQLNMLKSVFNLEVIVTHTSEDPIILQNTNPLLYIRILTLNFVYSRNLSVPIINAPNINALKLIRAKLMPQYVVSVYIENHMLGHISKVKCLYLINISYLTRVAFLAVEKVTLDCTDFDTYDEHKLLTSAPICFPNARILILHVNLPRIFPELDFRKCQNLERVVVKGRVSVNDLLQFGLPCMKICKNGVYLLTK